VVLLGPAGCSDDAGGPDDGSTGTPATTGTTGTDVSGDPQTATTADSSTSGETGGATDTGDETDGECIDQCGEICTDLQNDPAHCGTCGFACPPGLTCSEGACS
jgi:hypothetical protein